MIFAIVALSITLGILLGYGWATQDANRAWSKAWEDKQREIDAWIARIEAIEAKVEAWKQQR